jgi:hypothetical protein
VILHFGDHDPSGLDMTRDIGDRLVLFSNGVLARKGLDVKRMALNMDQIEEYGPPPNPAKEVDPRFAGYAAEFGNESWELDAMEPTALAELVEDEVLGLRDTYAWDRALKREAEARKTLRFVAEDWDNIAARAAEESASYDDVNDEDFDYDEEEED